MEQLTINHLAPYLPYDLMISARRMNDKDRNFNIGRMCEISNKSNHGNWVMLRHNNVVTVTSNTWNQSTSDMHTYFVPEDEVKPLLRPLSQLTEEIEHSGERFVPILKLFENLNPISCEIYTWKDNFKTISIKYKHEDGFMTRKEFHFQTLEKEVFERVQKLISWHFDVFGLIKKGLAIPIPSLNS